MYKVECINNLSKEYTNGYHRGDCTKCCGSCDIKNYYLCGLKFIDKFKSINDNYDIITLLATLLYSETSEKTIFDALKTITSQK